ncbi:rhodanese-like domain-containing protein [Haloferax mediterranei ATCC 33500]|uniref:Rhodanese n=1 Tax=Haloferax mediterranei (strain ATCC 33500 / DSM 1411 / JCM 8866 / NBRC 14739 / NCIMB 2177 / R-4) TaxID=523841 RepID=I3R1Z7_HALMT|nr:rhodanese-like domain-containing protein [Haloferax mediterranei]AFK18257.1 putative rhodanese [Haloferax mediterranei ATCC 33500]AHZ22342.1 sulfurtransferase [Haloferax mediterranei ATCC 33500]EMA02471.1 putative rhodanese [Haloferax mediterranei ATCC 33500]MDX5988346.1 rhodanese-like domain-containing protein [Haloferax mediterranei ATCC 33500]QCQ74779.1 rhodanese-like domain-containing protein [Haloferax mediterranei ATCC 33500]
MVVETTPDELREKLDADDTEVSVVDIRDPSSYTSGHIPGSENLPAATLGPEVFEREWPDEVVVSCYVGKSSKRVASILDENVDADVSSLRGGFDDWDGAVEQGSEDEADLGPASPF